MTHYRIPACPATGNPAIVYRASLEGPGIVAIQRRSGRGRWADVPPAMLRELMAAPTDLAAWLREQLAPAPAPRAAHRPRKDPAAARVTASYRIHPQTRQAIIAEAAETGESQGEVLDRWAAAARPARPARTPAPT